MSSKNLVFIKLFCRYTTKVQFVETGFSARRQLSSWNRNISVRGLRWSEILRKNKSNEDGIAEKINPKKSEDTSKTTVSNGQPVLKIIAPDIKETHESKISNEKIAETESNASPVADSTDETKKPKNELESDNGEIEKKEVQGDVKETVKKRVKLDLAAQSLERNFITPFRAMSEFLLKPSDLENLPRTRRRSPYECEPPITVYWRKDVEAKAMETWGSKEALNLELLKRDIEKKRYQQNIFMVKRRLRDYRREISKSAGETVKDNDPGLSGRSGRVVLIAVGINMANCLFKLFAWLYTGSHSMFSECIHSLADTVNQVILAFGIHKSVQLANSYHPYGYNNMKYVASLVSGVGIFCVGTGLSFYHGITGIMNPQPLSDFFWAYFILGGSFVSEGATCMVAFNSIRKGAKEAKMSIQEYIFKSKDPSVNVVLLEDFAAVVGVVVAAGCMSWATMTNSSIPDSIGCLGVGCILGSVASFIIYSNIAALVGRSIPEDDLNKINCELESDVMVRAIHDVKGIDMGNYLVRYKAEVDFDGRELTRSYLDKQDLNVLLEECRKIENIDQLEEFILKHGENIVDSVGGEIDRIEMKLRKKHPEIRHCDLEIL